MSNELTRFPSHTHYGDVITYYDDMDSCCDAGILMFCERCEYPMTLTHYLYSLNEQGQRRYVEQYTDEATLSVRLTIDPDVIQANYTTRVRVWSFDVDGVHRPSQAWLDEEHHETYHGSWSPSYDNDMPCYDNICLSCASSLDDDDQEYRDSNDSDDDDDDDALIKSYSCKFGDQYSLRFHEVGSDGTVVRRGQPTAALFDGETRYTTTTPHRAPATVSVPYFGLELEVMPQGNCSSRSASQALASIDGVSYPSSLMLKYDGSVEGGFEIVTQPHTLEALRVSPVWEVLDNLRQQGMRSWEVKDYDGNSTCGLHIHVSNSSFVNVGHAMRFVLFIYHNHEPLKRFAGRNSRRWAAFDLDTFRSEYVSYSDNIDGSVTPVIRSGLRRLMAKEQSQSSRYLAVNVGDTHSHTIELRFFRGCMLPWVNMANVEFVHALHAYTMGLTSHDCIANNALSWRAFLAWLKGKSLSEGFQYSMLVRRLSDGRRNHFTQDVTNTDDDGNIVLA